LFRARGPGAAGDAQLPVPRPADAPRQRLSALPAFNVGATPILDTTRLYYDGNSQAESSGGALAAVGVDNDRATLGVPGMNYSTLLQRSVDFDSYRRQLPGSRDRCRLCDNYPRARAPLNLSLIQLLWDRAEANGYALT